MIHKTYFQIVLFFFFIFGFYGCSSTLHPFTEQIYNEFGHSDRNLSKVQFYLSRDIVLYRDYGGTRSNVVNGKIRIVDGRTIEEVVFKKGTPGVFVFSPRQSQIAISFEEGEGKHLMFGANENIGGRFVLLAKEWNRRRGKVTYDNKVWFTTDESAYANLLVDLEKARKTRISQKTVKGRKI